MTGFVEPNKEASEIVSIGEKKGGAKFFTRSQAHGTSEGAENGLSSSASTTKLPDGSTVPNPNFEISLKHFDILGILGEGAFGKARALLSLTPHLYR